MKLLLELLRAGIVVRITVALPMGGDPSWSSCETYCGRGLLLELLMH